MRVQRAKNNMINFLVLMPFFIEEQAFDQILKIINKQSIKRVGFEVIVIDDGLTN